MTINNFDKKSLEEDMLDISDDDINAASFSNSSKGGYKPADFEPVSYLELLRQGRKNYKPEGFDFDVDTFENLCANWVPKKNFPLLLHCDASDLDAFCRRVYNMDFASAYDVLNGVADAWARRAINNLAQKGNNTALACVIKHFMKLEENTTPQPNITIVNDLGPSSKFSAQNRSDSTRSEPLETDSQKPV